MSQGSSSSSIDLKRVSGNAIATGAGASSTGTLRVQLSDESLAALENISITVPGTVDLGTVSLAALETITVEQTDATKFKTTSKITDGTNSATVKAASTAAVAGDTALVVAISPNNSVAVSGTVAATQSGTWSVTAVDGGGSLTVDGTFWQATQPVSVAASVAVTDNSGSLTVDAPATTPVFVRLSTGSAAIDTIPVSLASLPSGAVTNAGTFAVQVDGSALTSLQLLDDTVIADNATFGTTKMFAVGGTDGTNSQVISVTSGGLVNIADGGGAITVDGTVAVSGSVAVTGTFWQATQPVSGTFWQATQPVSIASTVAITDNSGSITVDGTFWQATQPVSIAASVGVTDASGSLTVDAPVGTPVFVRLSNGSTAIDTIPVTASHAAKTNNSVSAYAASMIAKASAGTLYMINGYNAKTSDQWIQLHDTTSLPADGSAPKLTLLAPAESNFFFDFGVYGRAFATGITISNSTTGATKTIGAADCWFDAQFT